jgi:hypothetical protein
MLYQTIFLLFLGYYFQGIPTAQRPVMTFEPFASPRKASAESSLLGQCPPHLL